MNRNICKKIEKYHEAIAWMDKTYVEEASSIIRTVENACINHACSVEHLFEALKEINSIFPDRKTMISDVVMLAKMSDHGITSSRAGKDLAFELLNRRK